MCCFSNAPALERVTGTQIFARMTPQAQQLLVYSMTVHARGALAMVLPLPVPPDSAEDAVRFINLEGYPRFFEDMSRGFPQPVFRGLVPRSRAAAPSAPLVVHDVGDFEASFVPTVDDFDRLDPRFRIPRAIWQQLPEYRTHGFAVFKLKGFDGVSAGGGALGSSAASEKRFHPMALAFPTRHPDQLFFPTVHIHDGRVHQEAAFDHTLYCQLPASHRPVPDGWEVSSKAAHHFMDAGKTRGIVAPEAPIVRRRMKGVLPNRDTWM